MPITYIYIYICMHTIKVYHQWGQFLSEQYIPEIRTILLHLLYFLIRFEYCYIIINDYVCACVWLLLLMTICYKNKEFQLPAVQFFIHQSPFCYMPLGQMRVVYTKELYYCYVKYFQLKKKTKFEYGTNFSTILFVIDFIPSAFNELWYTYTTRFLGLICQHICKIMPYDTLKEKLKRYTNSSSYNITVNVHNIIYP